MGGPGATWFLVRMNKPLQVLIIEDSESDTILLLALLRQAGFDPQFRRVGTPEGLRTALAAQKWDLVLSDHSMPGFDSRAALAIVRGTDRDLPFIIVSGMIGDEAAVAAMIAGPMNLVTEAPTLPAPNRPRAKPLRRSVNHALFHATPTLKLLPTKPTRKASTSSMG